MALGDAEEEGAVTRRGDHWLAQGNRLGFHGRAHLDRAFAIYKLWTEKEPDVSSMWRDPVTQRTVDWDELQFAQLGRAKDILYISDKWEADGVLERYHHPFDTLPAVYCATEDAEGKERPLAQLVGEPVSKAKALQLVLLAVVEELVVVREGKTNLTLRYKDDPPPLCSTRDKKGLVIITKDRGPIFVRGGQMTVTSRGIVK